MMLLHPSMSKEISTLKHSC